MLTIGLAGCQAHSIQYPVLLLLGNLNQYSPFNNPIENHVILYSPTSSVFSVLGRVSKVKTTIM